jgi:transcriptional regulator with XRE-family HTH domain
MVRQSVRQQLRIIEAIASARKQANLSQKELSLRISKSSTLMQKIESGTRGVSVQDLIVIARALDMDPCELLRRAL